MKMKNKVAMVLGAIKGIGKAIALDLARKGTSLVLNYYDWQEELKTLESDLAPYRESCLIVRTDLRRTEAINNLVQQCIKRFGRLDILINNIERGGLARGPWTLPPGSMGSGDGDNPAGQMVGI